MQLHSDKTGSLVIWVHIWAGNKDSKLYNILGKSAIFKYLKGDGPSGFIQSD